MVEYREWVSSLLKGKKVRFKCDCIMRMDVTGVVIDAEYSGNEIIYIVDTNGKYTKIGSNTPSLMIEIL